MVLQLPSSSFVVVLLTTTALYFVAASDARYVKRSDTTNVCSRSTPCGWEVYRPRVRTFDYFIKSPCDCPEKTKCVRVSDDISISAYVYQCKPLEDMRHPPPFDSRKT